MDNLSTSNVPRSATLAGHLVDLHQRRIYPATVEIADGKVHSVHETDTAPSVFLLPGFVDAHIHVESSMLTPGQFARTAVTHGTVATVSDPHEIANVLGVDGVRFMLNDAQQVPLKIRFGAPSCVPATVFESAGAELDAVAVRELLGRDDIHYLSEVMNYPGVLAGDQEVLAKISAAHALGKPVDGHAPGLRGADAMAYIRAGIRTDHECASIEEARDKLAAGCKIQIREGSAAKNFAALFPLVDQVPDACMFCSDDKHPNEFSQGHINLVVQRAVAEGLDLMNVLQTACINPVRHYGLDVGLLRPGDAADFIVVEDLKEFRVLETYLQGQCVARHGSPLFDVVPPTAINNFVAMEKTIDDFRLTALSKQVLAIAAHDGQLVTDGTTQPACIQDGLAIANPQQDLLKIAVVNRYANRPPAMAFIKNFGLKHGAIASSVAHDCHNIVAVGTNDQDLCGAVNAVIRARGGLSVVVGSRSHVLPLPVAGLMSTSSCDEVGGQYARLDRLAKDLGSPLSAPFMTLSFMALLVIPQLKLSDLGLFDAAKFQFVSPFA